MKSVIGHLSPVICSYGSGTFWLRGQDLNLRPRGAKRIPRHMGYEFKIYFARVFFSSV
jgi:hypothetical protein